MHSIAKSENGVDETFEDLLSKYKQIQLELECIRKEENMALEPTGSPSRAEVPEDSASIPKAKPVPKTDSAPEAASIQSEAATETVPCPEKDAIKVFQAFNIKPLRQKLPTPAELCVLKNKLSEEADGEDSKEGENESELGQTSKPENENEKVNEEGPVELATTAPKGMLYMPWHQI